MAPESTPPAAEDKPSWFTPKRLLVIFCVINLLNYGDRGAIASNGVNGSPRKCNAAGICDTGSGIQGDFKLSYFRDGVLSSAFMVGLLVASPIFATLAKSCNPFRLIGVGLAIWTLATAGCGFSVGFWSIFICRMLVGVGEASFVSLAAPFIDDNAPESQKTAWLAAFYMCIPSGIAFGYVYGGLVGSHLDWRYAFWGEALLMLPFAILGFIMKPLQLKGFESKVRKRLCIEGEVPSTQGLYSSGDGLSSRNDGLNIEPAKSSLSKGTRKVFHEFTTFWKDLKALLHEMVFVINVLGYIAYTFVLGAYSYWGPKAAYSIYHMKNADLVFGGLTIICGILGTLAGGFVLDLMKSTISNAFKLLSTATFFGAILCFIAISLRNIYGYIAVLAMGELLLFAIQAPVNYVCLHCIYPSMRPLSMAVSTVSIHIFGDVPSSPLVGVLQDHVNNWRKTSLMLISVLFIASAIWFVGIFLRSVDRFKFSEESAPDISLPVITSPQPVVDEKAEGAPKTA